MFFRIRIKNVPSSLPWNRPFSWASLTVFMLSSSNMAPSLSVQLTSIPAGPFCLSPLK